MLFGPSSIFCSGSDNTYDEDILKLGLTPITVSPIEKSFINADKLADELKNISIYDGIVMTSVSTISAIKSAVSGSGVDFKKAGPIVHLEAV